MKNILNLFKSKKQDEVINTKNKMDDEKGNCKQCGHPFNPHIVIAYDTSDFSKGGEMRCHIDGCKCFNTLNFNLKKQ